MVRKRLLLVVAVVLLSLGNSGCPKDPYRASIQGSSDVSQAVSSAIKITAEYYSTGVFSDRQKATAAGYFMIVTDCNMKFRKAVVDVHNAGQTGVAAFLPVADTFVNCTRAAPSVANDPTVEKVLQSVDLAINGISLAVSSAKGGK